jgi:hypothetical protein
MLGAVGASFTRLIVSARPAGMGSSERRTVRVPTTSAKRRWPIVNARIDQT